MISELDLEGSGIERVEITVRKMADAERAERGEHWPEGWYVFYNVYRADHEGPVASGVVRQDAAGHDLMGFLVDIVRNRPRLVRDDTSPPEAS